MTEEYPIASAFEQFGLKRSLLRGLAECDFEQPTEIQQEMIPLALEGRDILGQARTGTGKTAAFGLPIVQQIDRKSGVQAVVLAPTRELAVQITGEFQRISHHARIKSVAIYGGQKISIQYDQLKKGCHVIVGTPGRVIDMLRRRAFNFEAVRFVVVDEVDRMLDMGFRDDIRWILGRVTSPHQTIFASATISVEIARMAGQYMKNPVRLDVSRDELTVESVSQAYITSAPRDKSRLLIKLIEHESPEMAIVFCNTKRGVDRLAARLVKAGINASEIHGDLLQQKRQRVLESFRKQQIHVLVATDLAARGIDVHGITHIINYDIPLDPEVYVHRIGRTARMGAFGKAITLVTSEEGKELTAVEMLIGLQIKQDDLPPGFKPTPTSTPRDEAEKPRPLSRVQRPASSSPSSSADESLPTKPPRKTLGSKFRTRRRRR